MNKLLSIALTLACTHLAAQNFPALGDYINSIEGINRSTMRILESNKRILNRISQSYGILEDQNEYIQGNVRLHKINQRNNRLLNEFDRELRVQTALLNATTNLELDYMTSNIGGMSRVQQNYANDKIKLFNEITGILARSRVFNTNSGNIIREHQLNVNYIVREYQNIEREINRLKALTNTFSKSTRGAANSVKEISSKTNSFKKTIGSLKGGIKDILGGGKSILDPTSLLSFTGEDGKQIEEDQLEELRVANANLANIVDINNNILQNAQQSNLLLGNIATVNTLTLNVLQSGKESQVKQNIDEKFEVLAEMNDRITQDIKNLRRSNYILTYRKKAREEFIQSLEL